MYISSGTTSDCALSMSGKTPAFPHICFLLSPSIGSVLFFFFNWQAEYAQQSMVCLHSINLFWWLFHCLDYMHREIRRLHYESYLHRNWNGKLNLITVQKKPTINNNRISPMPMCNEMNAAQFAMATWNNFDVVKLSGQTNSNCESWYLFIFRFFFKFDFVFLFLSIKPLKMNNE